MKNIEIDKESLPIENEDKKYDVKMHENIELNNESDQLISNIEIKIDIEKPKDEFPKKSQMLSSISLNF